MSVSVTQKFVLLVFGLLVGFNACDALLKQSVGCKGRLMCGNRPATGVKVKLWDEDDGPDPDDVLAETYTDISGDFIMQGSTHELTTIDPVCKVYHDCDDLLPGQRKVKFKIPDSYITRGSNPRRIFDLGTINLETIFKSEERDLFPPCASRYCKDGERSCNDVRGVYLTEELLYDINV